METKEYRIKTKFIKQKNIKAPGVWETGLDIGYSAVKLMSPNICACFPFYARKIDPSFQFVGTVPPSAIFYKNLDTNEMWLVGEIAQDTMETGDTSDSETAMYGRERYSSPMFSVIAQTSMAVACMQNEYGAPKKDKMVIQTGLPAKYMQDEDDIRDSLCHTHNFAVKIGGGDWVEFRNFSVLKNNIFVMPQPRGALFSASMNDNGDFIKDSGKYINSGAVIFDPGFGTLDLYMISKRAVRDANMSETYSDLGMKRILQETSAEILNRYKVEIPVPAMQKYLESGKVRYMNRKTLESCDYKFDDILNDANARIFAEAFDRLTNVVDFTDFDYIIVTGGTGAAWLPFLKEKFKKSAVQVILANQNDKLPLIFSNARGYYLSRYKDIKRENKSQTK